MFLVFNTLTIRDVSIWYSGLISYHRRFFEFVGVFLEGAENDCAKYSLLLVIWSIVLEVVREKRRSLKIYLSSFFSIYFQEIVSFVLGHLTIYILNSQYLALESYHHSHHMYGHP